MARELVYRNWPVYQHALDFMRFANEVMPRIPKGYGEVADQLRRASTSITLNISEGAGRFLELDKQRFYLAASGSATECGGIVDILHIQGVINDEQHQETIELLGKISGGLEALSIAVGGVRHKNERWRRRGRK